MVPTPTLSVCGSPLHHFIPLGPTVTTRVYLRRQVIPSPRMQHYQAAGFSEDFSRLMAAPRRLSTNHMYDDRWLHFAHWATGQVINPLGPTAAQIANFLHSLLDTHGLLPQTLLPQATGPA